MVKTIIIWVAVAAVIILIVVWALTGGIGRAISSGRSLLSPSEWFSGNASGTSFTLPWIGSTSPATIDIGEDNFISSVSEDPQQDLNDLQSEYDRMRSEADRVKLFGNPSPQMGKVRFASNATGESDPAFEYVQVQNASPDPVSLTGWTLQSVYSGGRFPIPAAAAPLVTGAVNQLLPVTLASGAYADIVSGISPVSVSFRENICSGYLEQFQPFAPPLNQNCPDPGQALPVTEENLRTYGDTCIDFVRNTPPCHFPTAAELPATLTSACKAFVGDTFSYNGCVSAHRAEIGFNSDVWRVYLGSKNELWRNTHDVVRLLDETGRTVDVLTY